MPGDTSVADSEKPLAGGAASPLWRTDGARYGRSDVAATDGGGLEITQHDMGASERAAWGEDDNELSLTLAPNAVAELAVLLLRERFAGRPDALQAIRAFCEANDVESTLRAWT